MKSLTKSCFQDLKKEPCIYFWLIFDWTLEQIWTDMFVSSNDRAYTQGDSWKKRETWDVIRIFLNKVFKNYDVVGTKGTPGTVKQMFSLTTLVENEYVEGKAGRMSELLDAQKKFGRGMEV